MENNKIENELIQVLSQQEVDYSELQELEEIITPTSGCGCASGGLCF